MNGNGSGNEANWVKKNELAMGFGIEVDDGVEDCCTQIYGTQLTVPAIKQGYNSSNVLD